MKSLLLLAATSQVKRDWDTEMWMKFNPTVTGRNYWTCKWHEDYTLKAVFWMKPQSLYYEQGRKGGGCLNMKWKREMLPRWKLSGVGLSSRVWMLNFNLVLVTKPQLHRLCQLNSVAFHYESLLPNQKHKSVSNSIQNSVCASFWENQKIIELF